MNALLEQLSRFGVGRLIAMFGLTAGAAAALVFFTMSMNSNGQALLFSGLGPADAAAVSERLDQANIIYELREGGSAVYVNTDQVDEARMRVASGGALSFGSVGYEIFDETDALGTTQFVQNVNAKRALEGELSRSINTLASVSAARVHLVLPERRLFSRESEEPSASVVISVRGELPGSQIATIRNLVATAVPGLQANRITLADDQGRLLASPSDNGDLVGAMLDDRQASIENDLEQKVRDVVEGIVGPGAVRVAVTAELTRQSSTRTRLEYDPNGQVEVSRRAEEQSSSEPVTSGGVSVSENTPDAVETGQDAPVLATSESSVTERNYENTREETTTISQAGDLARLAVSVVVDEVASVAEDGTLTFTPRSAEELEQIRQLVAAAVGFPTDGDLVRERQILQVSSMRFNRPDITLGTPAPEGFSLARLDFMRIAEIVVLFITALMVIFLVARPLVQGAIGGVSGGAPALAGAGAASIPGLPSMPDGSAPALLANEDGTPILSAGEDMIGDDHVDVAQIDGQVKKSSVRKVAALVDQHPDESMSILRTWMHGDDA